MKKLFTLIAVVSLFSFTYAEAGGGGKILIPSKPDQCLVDNCNKLCQIQGADTGHYYELNRCWCDSYKDTEYGKIKEKGGWIEVASCTYKNDSNFKSDITSTSISLGNILWNNFIKYWWMIPFGIILSLIGTIIISIKNDSIQR